MRDASPRLTWRHIAPPRLEARAQSIVKFVADVVSDDPLGCALGGAGASPGLDFAGGLAGLGVMLAHAAQHFESKRYEDAARRIVDELIRLAPSSVTSLHTMGLFSGLAGIAFAVDDILTRIGDIEEHETAVDAEVDQAILSAVDSWPLSLTGAYDLIGGLVGCGVYGLGRLHLHGGAEISNTVARKIQSSARPWRGGRAWFSEDHIAYTDKRIVNLGLAHGLPGVVGFLGDAVAMRVAVGELRMLLDDSVRAMLATRLPDRFVSVYPSFTYESDEVDTASACRGAWCYGDPGIACSLLRAAAAGNSESQLSLPSLTERLLRRERSSLWIAGPGLCHGTAGVMHIANSIYQQTGNTAFKSWALDLMDELVSHCEIRQGEPGPIWDDELPDLKPAKKVGFGVLVGAAGVCLALLSAISAVRPSWDAPLMITRATLRSL